ncbi:MAG: hypothetical protein R3C99_00405 [Pirellulaceae bacterium]
MEKWPIGVFTSVDAGLGVKLELPAIWACRRFNCTLRPRRHARSERQAFLAKLSEFGITLTAVFGGFEGASYADIPTVVRTVGLVPPETRAARAQR